MLGYIELCPCFFKRGDLMKRLHDKIKRLNDFSFLYLFNVLVIKVFKFSKECVDALQSNFKFLNVKRPIITRDFEFTLNLSQILTFK